jgi:hypothetical protein
MPIAKTTAVVRFRVPGWHAWVNAPAHRRYLSFAHRHLFHVEAELAVLHDDREVEYHDLLDFCVARFPAGQYGGKSCEMLARELAEELVRQYPGRAVRVSVFEDGEVGSQVFLEGTHGNIHN